MGVAMIGIGIGLYIGSGRASGGGSAPASPPIFSDLGAYWRMDQHGTMSLTGGLVDQVDDLSGNGHQ
jgi:hypothetical protein